MDYNPFETENTTACFRFDEQILRSLMPDRKPGDTRKIFLELVRESRGKHVWFNWEPPTGKQDPGRDTLQLIEVTIKRIK